MNRIGGRSQHRRGRRGPGALPPRRERRLAAQRRSSRSPRRASASPRDYLVNADELQIKMAQGAKPGEGGQLPGHKVDAVIARVRHSTPGVTLISPPPHHDIYSIEDLAQLIFDLKNVNPRARISVKLVAEAGVGTIAAGVAKAHADVDPHQRPRRRHRRLAAHVDPPRGRAVGARPRRGAAGARAERPARRACASRSTASSRPGATSSFGALLGAEEFGFATAPLVASGCIMMRKCHLNTCPVGVATQDPELREQLRRQARARHPLHLLRRRGAARASWRSSASARVDEMVGRVDCIVAARARACTPKARAARLLRGALPPEARPARTAARCVEAQDHDLARRRSIARSSRSASAGARAAASTSCIDDARSATRDRAFGAMLARRDRAPPRRRRARPRTRSASRATGSAGQSFGAFAARGLTLELEGDANDYVGKGLSGGVARGPSAARGAASAPTSRSSSATPCSTARRAGARSSTAAPASASRCATAARIAVVEGVGDHGCEYMTGGTVVVLGTTGRNFAAGMSGGVAYVLRRGRRVRARAATRRWSSSRRSTSPTSRAACARSSRSTSQRTGSAQGAASCSTRWDARRADVREGHARPSTERVLEARASPRDGARRHAPPVEPYVSSAVGPSRRARERRSAHG